jgi:hypothetical protein
MPSGTTGHLRPPSMVPDSRRRACRLTTKESWPRQVVGVGHGQRVQGSCHRCSGSCSPQKTSRFKRIRAMYAAALLISILGSRTIRDEQFQEWHHQGRRDVKRHDDVALDASAAWLLLSPLSGHQISNTPTPATRRRVRRLGDQRVIKCGGGFSKLPRRHRLGICSVGLLRGRRPPAATIYGGELNTTVGSSFGDASCRQASTRRPEYASGHEQH